MCTACQVHVDVWRTQLWQDALKAQDIHDPELAGKLQHKFRTARLEHFQLEAGVKVGACCPLQHVQCCAWVHWRFGHDLLASKLLYCGFGRRWWLI